MKIKKNSKIKIIGDSIAAGVGSSNLIDTHEIIFEDEGIKYFMRIGPNSWWGLLDKYLKEKNMNCNIINKGAGGGYSYQINKYLNDLISPEDDIIVILMGLNDRKRVNGMEELKNNLSQIINKIKSMNKEIIIFTPTPSANNNEYFPNRLFHTPDVVDVIRKVSAENNIEIIDIYEYINNYLDNNNLLIEDIIYEEGCRNDGLHPSDFVQRLMFEKIKSEIKI